MGRGRQRREHLARANHMAGARSATCPPPAAQAKAIQRLMEGLCGELRGVAVPLVDAFGIPDFVLRAPIGLSTGQHDPYYDYLHAVGFNT